jgi:hypothetical protein
MRFRDRYKSLSKVLEMPDFKRLGYSRKDHKWFQRKCEKWQKKLNIIKPFGHWRIKLSAVYMLIALENPSRYSILYSRNVSNHRRCFELIELSNYTYTGYLRLKRYWVLFLVQHGITILHEVNGRYEPIEISAIFSRSETKPKL